MSPDTFSTHHHAMALLQVWGLGVVDRSAPCTGLLCPAAAMHHCCKCFIHPMSRRVCQSAHTACDWHGVKLLEPG